MQFLPRAKYHFTEESRSFHEMHKTTVEIVSVESDCFVWAPLYLKRVASQPGPYPTLVKAP